MRSFATLVKKGQALLRVHIQKETIEEVSMTAIVSSMESYYFSYFIFLQRAPGRFFRLSLLNVCQIHIFVSYCFRIRIVNRFRFFFAALRTPHAVCNTCVSLHNCQK